MTEHAPLVPSRRHVLQAMTVGAGALVAAPLVGEVLPASAAAVPPGVLHDLPIDRPYDGATSANLMYDGRFLLWHAGTARAIPWADGRGTGINFCGMWIGAPRALPGGTQPQSAIVVKHHPTEGGMRIKITGPGAMYLRQRLPNVLQYSGKTLTISMDVENDKQIEWDVYAQCRYNTSTARTPEGDRVLAVDTQEIVLAPGRHRLVCTFTVPKLNPNLYALDFRNCLELSIRPQIPNGQTGATVIIREVTLLPTTKVYTKYNEDVAREANRLRAYYETGSTRKTGLSSARGRKLVAVPFRTRKWRDGGSPALTTKDLQGRVGKISLINVNGTMTHNVTPTKQSLNRYRDSFNIFVDGSTATGLAFTWTYDLF